MIQHLSDIVAVRSRSVIAGIQAGKKHRREPQRSI